MMSQFIGGKALFMFNGDWESGNLDKQMAGNAGLTSRFLWCRFFGQGSGK